MKQDINEKRLAGEIRARMSDLRNRLASQPESVPFEWIIPDALACSQRPLRDRPEYQDATPLPREAGPLVLAWIEAVKAAGIRSIICLMHAKELRYYDNLDSMEGGLLTAYRKAGYEVRHLPWPDPFHGKTAQERSRRFALVESIKIQAADAYENLPKPVLIHCSAAIDRSPPVAAYVAIRVGGLLQ